MTSSTPPRHETSKRTKKIKRKKSKKSRKDYDSTSSSEEESSSSSSDSEDERVQHRKSQPKKKKSSHRRDSSSDDSSSSSEDKVWKSRRKDRTHRWPKKKERNPFDQLVKDMAELKVHIATPKEKRKDGKALRHDLWCILCGNPSHTKEECRLPIPLQPAPIG
ncbi:hypothetical protein R1flu_019505 [Riccia fluitans]|uniref:CCHC-type domain-containing protein n=1 Tax=Riccia fluitans TaxID=41844 RepID=A0ABD1ZIU0_9MARC